MARTGKRGRDATNDYEADDFVEDDEGSTPKTKKTKKASASGSSKTKNKFFEVRPSKQWSRLDGG